MDVPAARTQPLVAGHPAERIRANSLMHLPGRHQRQLDHGPGELGARRRRDDGTDSAAASAAYRIGDLRSLTQSSTGRLRLGVAATSGS